MLLIVAVWVAAAPEPPDDNAAIPAELFTVADADTVLLLLAAPEVAPPAVVLVVVRALPLYAPWPFDTDSVTEL